MNCEQCSDFYIGESARKLNIRVKEHLTKSASAIHAHIQKTGHSIKPEKISIICREDNTSLRKSKESIEIRQYDPPLNRDDGNRLPQIYNPLLTCKRALHDRSCDSMSHDL